MKTAISVGLISSLVANSVAAAPMVSVGDNVDIFFNLSTTISSDDNITASPTEALDDTIFSVTPGLEVDFFRGETLWDAVFRASYELLRYSDNDQFDADNLNVNFAADYVSPVLQGRFSAGFAETQEKTQQVAGDLIQVETSQVRGSVKYNVTEKVAVSVSPSFVRQNYVDDFGTLLPDKDTLTIGLKGFYAISPKYDLTVGFAYRDQDIDDLNGNIGSDPEDYRFTVGVDGEILPKVTGSFDFGYTERSFNNGTNPDQDTIFIAGDLTWAATQKISVKLGLSQDFESTAAGNAIESSSAVLSADYLANEFWIISPFVRFLKDDYSNQAREDEVTSIGLNVGYSPNAFLDFGLRTYYLENDSNVGLDYDNTVFELSASLRY